MLNHHTHTAAHDFNAAPEAVYRALQTQDVSSGNLNAFGAFLSMKPQWGKAGEVGYQLVSRINWGAADLVMTETLLAADPPHSLKIAQRPQALLPYDPSERLPPLGFDVPANLDKLFAKTYGTPPATTEIQFDLSPTANGTTLTLSIDARITRKLSWFEKRRWHKKVPEQAALIFAQIQSALDRAEPL